MEFPIDDPLFAIHKKGYITQIEEEYNYNNRTRFRSNVFLGDGDVVMFVNITKLMMLNDTQNLRPVT